MRPSRIVVGEVRQEECLDLTQLAWTYTGRRATPTVGANRFFALWRC